MLYATTDAQQSQSGYPCWAPCILEYLGHKMHHVAQLSLAEFAASHLRDVIFNLDMLTIARTTKLTPPDSDKVKAEDEASREEAETESALNSLAEMQEEVGGGADEAKAEEEASFDRTIALHCFETEELRALLSGNGKSPKGKEKEETH